MKKTIFLIIASKFLVVAASAQLLQSNWSVSGGGAGIEYMEETCLTSGNGLLAAGTFSGAMEIEGITYNSVSGGSDIYIIKYNASNTIEWVKTYGNACNEKLAGITSDAAGNIYMTGSFYNAFSIDFNTVFSAGSEDLFFASLDANGNLNWLQSFGSTSSDAGAAVEAAPDGNIVLAAELTNTGFQLTDQASTGVSVHIAKFTASGVLLWSNCESGDASSNIEIEDLAIDLSGTIYVTGSYFGSILAGDNGSVQMQSGIPKMWAGSYTAEGSNNYIYTPVTDASNISGGSAVSFNSASNPVIAGITSGQITIGNDSWQSSDNDVMLLELDAAGIPVWSSVVVAPGYQQPNKIAVNAQDAIGISGLYIGDFNTGATILPYIGGSDGYFMLYENGIVSSAVAMQSTGNDNANCIIIREEEFIIGGNFSGSSNAPMTIGSTIHQSNGDNDIYLVSWSENQPTGISEQQTATKLIGYPNPATSYINLEGKFESVKVKVNVYSVEGKLVLATETETAFDSRITLNTEELNPGTYIAVVEDSGVRSSVSFMIR